MVYTCLLMPCPPGAGTIATGTKRTANRISSSNRNSGCDGFGKLQRPRATGSSDQRNHNALPRPPPMQPDANLDRRLQQQQHRWGPKSGDQPTAQSVH